MPKDVDKYVAENTQRLRDVDSRFVQVDSDRTRDLSFGSNFINVEVDLTVSTRSTGSQVQFGHPDESKGFDKGTFGEDRGSWSTAQSGATTAEFTKQGREAAAEALAGREGAVEYGQAGGNDAEATTNDTSLYDRLAQGSAFATRSSNTLTATVAYGALSIIGLPGEFGLFDRKDRLLCRVTTDKSTLSIADTDDVQSKIRLTFTGSGNGAAVVTTEGENALADALVSPTSSIGPVEFAFGSGTDTFAKSDTTITTEEFRKNIDTETGRDRIFVFTQVTESDMTQTSNALAEVVLFDNNGRMIWATTFRPVLANSPGFTTDVTIVVG